MTSAHHHVALWLDHREARIIHFNATEADEISVQSSNGTAHLHTKTGSAAGTHRRRDDSYFREVAEAIGTGKAVLLTGPADAKIEFLKYVVKHDPKLATCIDTVETSKRMTSRQLTAHARDHFKIADRMTSQIPH